MQSSSTVVVTKRDIAMFGIRLLAMQDEEEFRVQHVHEAAAFLDTHFGVESTTRIADQLGVLSVASDFPELGLIRSALRGLVNRAHVHFTAVCMPTLIVPLIRSLKDLHWYVLLRGNCLVRVPVPPFITRQLYTLKEALEFIDPRLALRTPRMFSDCSVAEPEVRQNVILILHTLGECLQDVRQLQINTMNEARWFDAELQPSAACRDLYEMVYDIITAMEGIPSDEIQEKPEAPDDEAEPSPKRARL